jgi:hypothetical protein
MAGDDEQPPHRSERSPDRSPERAADRAADRSAERSGERPAITADRTSSPENPLDDVHDELPETIRQRLERLVPELVKKTFTAGMGAVFSTEENIRKIARESLPEVAGYIAQSADGAKDKVFEAITRETRDFLSNLNVAEEIAKILTTLSFEIKTEIRFIPNSDRFVGAEPDVKASVRLKRNEDRVGKDDRRDDRKDDEPRDGRDTARDSKPRLRFWQRERDPDGEPGDPEPDK